MYYRFKLKSGKYIKVFVNDFVREEKKNIYGVVSWNGSENTSEYEEVGTYLIKRDDNKLYFDYNGEIVFMQDFIASTPEELVNKIKSSDWVNSNELTWTLMKYGINSLKVDILKKPASEVKTNKCALIFKVLRSPKEDKSDWDRIEYKFEETSLFKLENNFKIRLTPANKNDADIYASSTYYIRDLVELLTHCKDKYIIRVA